MKQPEVDTKTSRVFEQLVHGRHICDVDGVDYFVLRDRFDEPKTLFGRIGYRLIRHPADFYYFELPEGGSSNVSPPVQKISIFVYTLIEHLADQGESISDAIQTREFDISQRPFVGHPRYIEYWRTVDVDPSVEGVQKVLQTMTRMGFTEKPDGYKFFFRTPIRRFFDIARQVVPREASTKNGDSEETWQ